MSILIIIMRVLALICLASTLICGLYLAAYKDNKEKIADLKSSLRFHKNLAVVTVLVSAASVLL